LHPMAPLVIVIGHAPSHNIVQFCYYKLGI
jgi:hypothetical protein